MPQADLTRIDVRVDISDHVSLDVPLSTAAWVYVPAPRLGKPSTVVFAFPGASYTRSYYDLDVPGRTGYSLARYLAEAGCIVVACDHVGIGDSTPYEPFEQLTKQRVVSADRGTVQAVLAGLANGSLVEGLDPIADPCVVGVGHSLGGYLLARQQAVFRTFDAVAILGWSPFLRFADSESWSAFISAMPDRSRPPREPYRRFFHGDGADDDVVAADDATATRVYLWMYREQNGLRDDPWVSEGAHGIDVPLFLGFGALDVSPDPHAELRGYPNASDITVFVVPGSAHCFNLAATRALFYERLAAWIGGLAPTARGRAGSFAYEPWP